MYKHTHTHENQTSEGEQDMREVLVDHAGVQTTMISNSIARRTVRYEVL
jgi:hypothetical protein